jgi:hypothetical protein
MAVAFEGPARAAGPLGFTNGSFESGGAAPFTSSTPGWGQWIGPAAAGSDYGVAQSSVSPKVAQDGSFYAFFHANQQIVDCIGETMNTVVGQQYLVSFWLATDGPTNAQSSLMTLVWGPDFAQSSNDQLFNVYQATSASPQPYAHITLTITAGTNHDILAFHGYDATSDIVIDDVTVTPLNVTNAPATRPWTLTFLVALLTGVAMLVLGRKPTSRTST